MTVVSQGASFSSIVHTQRHSRDAIATPLNTCFGLKSCRNVQTNLVSFTKGLGNSVSPDFGNGRVRLTCSERSESELWTRSCNGHAHVKRTHGITFRSTRRPTNTKLLLTTAFSHETSAPCPDSFLHCTAGVAGLGRLGSFDTAGD